MLAAISSTSDLKITITITNTLKKEYEVFFDSLLLINIETTTGQPVQYIGPQFDVENPYTSDSLYKKIKPDETLTLGPVDCSFGFELTKGTTYVVRCNNSNVGYCEIGSRNSSFVTHIVPNPINITH